ncbi:MAG: hypothetical protein ABSE59_02665 [Opitutaceae bacterium]|jgi:ferric-dicitrate binding protein FerR (iron transport regulator)
MNTTPDSSGAWRALRAHAAAQLPPDFADRVLRLLRTPVSPVREAADRLLIAACTAAACVLLVMLVHAHNTQKINQEAMANWRQFSTQADSYASLP